ncbi:MAG: glycoside hydrolase family 30 protein [Bacteroides sp.]|nr:glycoside hydrolase family 30 protein [Bacteroides sp.]
MMRKLTSLLMLVSALGMYAQSSTLEWVSTTNDTPWQTNSPVKKSKKVSGNQIIVNPSSTFQTIQGFGFCFSELGWESLSSLGNETREEIMQEFFKPGQGANFTICRLPIAGNDIDRGWYSYNENVNDFEMLRFSIEPDREMIIPFIKKAQQYLPSLKIWSSPWCPPTWMKHNAHYASRSSQVVARKIKELMDSNPTIDVSSYMTKMVDNYLPENRQGSEGTDMIIAKDIYLKSYALYFSKFIDAYRKEGVNIFAVAPQNEFNSPQVFPSCCWTATTLAKFIGKYLGPEMKKRNVDIILGTVERANESLCDTILNDADCKKYITAVGFQWAGKDALPGIHKRYPHLEMYQTEQECGDGKNDWKGAEHSWGLLRHYLSNGTSMYIYWNPSLMQGGTSGWGWAQNSLVLVHQDGKGFSYTPEYYVLKHASHYVMPGAKRVDISLGNYTDALAFQNPDGSIVVLAANQQDKDKKVTIKIKDLTYSPVLAAHSVNTFVYR